MLEELKQENAKLKEGKVWNLSDLPNLVGRPSCSSGLGPALKKAKTDAGSWDVVSQVSRVSQANTSMTSCTSKQMSLGVMEDFTPTNLQLYIAIRESVLTHWSPPAKEVSTYTRGTRAMTVQEVEAAASREGFPVEDFLKRISQSVWECYVESSSKKVLKDEKSRPVKWPRTDRTRLDDEISKRKATLLMDLTYLVQNELGELTHGPLDPSMNPEVGQPGFLSTFLYRRMGEYWPKANAGVSEGLRSLTIDARNRYLTVLLKPLTWLVVKCVLEAIWLHISNFDWVNEARISFNAELEFLNAKISDSM